MPSIVHRLTRDLSALENLLALEFATLGAPLARHLLERTVIDFCERTFLWQEDLGPFTLNGPGCEVVELNFSNRRFVPVQVRSVFARSECGREETRIEHGDGRVGWVEHGPFAVRIYPFHALAGLCVTVNVAVKPKMGSFEVSEWLLQDYFEAFLSGARARAYMLPGKPWTDPGLAAFHHEQYEQAVYAGRAREGRDFARGLVSGGRRPVLFY